MDPISSFLVRLEGLSSPLPARISPARVLTGEQFEQIVAVRTGAIPASRREAVTRPVTRQGAEFQVDGQPFRFVGLNAYDLVQIAEQSQAELEKVLTTIAASGATVVRFWAFAGHDPEVAGRIFDTSQRLKLGLRFIPVLGNHWDSMESGKQAKTKDLAWYAGGFREEYLPHVRAMVQAHGGRPEVLLWEIINEPVTRHVQALHAFVAETARTIKANGGSLTAVGSFGGVQAGQTPHQYRKLAAIPEIDAVSMHDYARNWYETRWGLETVSKKLLSWLGDKEVALDAKVARDVNKPFYVGEFGTKVAHDGWRVSNNMPTVRTPVEALQGNLARGNLAIQEGAQGVLMWGPQHDSRSPDGHGFGFTYHTDDPTGQVLRGVIHRLKAEWSDKDKGESA